MMGGVDINNMGRTPGFRPGMPGAAGGGGFANVNRSHANTSIGTSGITMSMGGVARSGATHKLSTINEAPRKR